MMMMMMEKWEARKETRDDKVLRFRQGQI